jgi:hypothetical protein
MHPMIPEVIQRFILTSIDSVPYLEAILMLRYDPTEAWTPKRLAETLYINENKAEEILTNLYSGKFVNKDNGSYSFDPASLDLKQKIDQLAEIYTSNLIEVTNLIHLKTNKQAQQFGDAFRWQKEDEKG